MDNNTSQRIAEIVATAIATKLADKVIDEIIKRFEGKKKTPKSSRRRKLKK